jgi:hypothetical protein
VYLEKLPEECPPNNAEDKEYSELWRALPSIKVSSQHFFSKAKMGERLPLDMDPCRFASCSLITTRNQASKMLRFPKLRGGTLAKLQIPARSGKSMKKKQHVDFWAYSGFNFLEAILEVENGEAN